MYTSAANCTESKHANKTSYAIQIIKKKFRVYMRWKMKNKKSEHFFIDFNNDTLKSMAAYYYNFLKILTPVSYLKYLNKFVSSVKIKSLDQPEKALEKLVSPDIYRV